jgi:hypothetical protein
VNRRSFGLAALVCGAAALLAGCSGESGYGRYVPTGTSAREALQSTLEAWKKGENPGERKLGDVSLAVFESKWQAGQKLASYEILEEEEASGTAPRWFKVRLQMKPSGQVTTRYAVLGNNPLMVYREEDFQKISGRGM